MPITPPGLLWPPGWFGGLSGEPDPDIPPVIEHRIYRSPFPGWPVNWDVPVWHGPGTPNLDGTLSVVLPRPGAPGVWLYGHRVADLATGIERQSVDAIVAVEIGPGGEVWTGRPARPAALAARWGANGVLVSVGQGAVGPVCGGPPAGYRFWAADSLPIDYDAAPDLEITRAEARGRDLAFGRLEVPSSRAWVGVRSYNAAGESAEREEPIAGAAPGQLQAVSSLAGGVQAAMTPPAKSSSLHTAPPLPGPPAGLLESWSVAPGPTDGTDLSLVRSLSQTRDGSANLGSPPSYAADRGGLGPSVRFESGEYLDLAAPLVFAGAFRVHVVHERDSGAQAMFLGSASDDSGLFADSAGEYHIGAGGDTWVGPTDANLGPHIVTYERDDEDNVAVYRNGVLLGDGARAGTVTLHLLGHRNATSPFGTTGAWVWRVAAFDGSAELAAELAWLAALYPGLV